MRIAILNLRKGSLRQRGPHLLASLLWRSRGFSLLEALVALAAVGVLFTALYSGITFGLKEVKLSREGLEATQLVQSKTELMRLYSWSRLMATNWVSPTFTNTFLAAGQSNGVIYTGTIVLTNAGLAESYNTNLTKIIVTVIWTNGTALQQRQMITLVSKYGMQNYIY
jgi:prepilin-type N-terminal cleavage/methylation domain-containing protein